MTLPGWDKTQPREGFGMGWTDSGSTSSSPRTQPSPPVSTHEHAQSATVAPTQGFQQPTGSTIRWRRSICRACPGCRYLATIHARRGLCLDVRFGGCMVALAGGEPKAVHKHCGNVGPHCPELPPGHRVYLYEPVPTVDDKRRATGAVGSSTPFKSWHKQTKSTPPGPFLRRMSGRPLPRDGQATRLPLLRLASHGFFGPWTGSHSCSSRWL